MVKQYIDKSAIVAEINKLIKKNELYLNDNVSDAIRFQKIGAYSVLCDLCHFLDTLEVKEVFSAEEFYDFLDTLTGKDNGHLSEGELFRIAEYFYELGLKTQKGE